MIPTLLVLLFALGEDPDLPLLGVGDAVEGVIVEGDREVRTATLDEGYTEAPTVGRSYRIEVEESGTYHVDLWSSAFDAYLVLRDREGEVLAEDDDGLAGTDARLVVELEAGVGYVLEACALHGERGPWSLRLGLGPPEVERGIETLDEVELRELIAHLERDAPGSLRLAEAWRQLGLLLWVDPPPAEAQEAFERSLALHEAQVEPDEIAVLEVANSLGIVASERGELELADETYSKAYLLAQRVLGPDKSGTLQLLVNWARTAEDRGQYERAATMNAGALERARVVLGEEDFLVRVILGNLAVTLGRAGRYAEAEERQRELLELTRRLLGPRHPEVAQVLANLGTHLLNDGRYVEGVELLRQSVAILEEELGPESPALLHPLDSLTFGLGELNQYEEALAVAGRVRGLALKLFGPGHPETAEYNTVLAARLNDVGRYEEALAVLGDSLAILEANLGEEHLRTIDLRRQLGVMLLNSDRFTEAAALLESVLASQERILGPDHSDLSSTLEALFKVDRWRGDYELARTRCEWAIRIREAVLGPDHPDVVRFLGDLAAIHEELGDLDAARELLERRLASTSRSLGPQHLDVGSTLVELGRLRRNQGDFVGARSAYERALAVFEGVLDPGHALVAICLQDLARLLRDLGELEEALGLAQRAAGILATNPDVNQREHAAMFTLLGELHRDLGDHEAARASCERALLAHESLRGGDVVFTSATLELQAKLLADEGRYEEELEVRRQVLRVREEHYGADHSEVASGLNNMATVLERLGRRAEADASRERALAQLERIRGHGARATVAAALNLAMAQFEAGAHEEAWETLERGAEARRATVASTLSGLSEAEGFQFLGLWAQTLDLRLSLGAQLGRPEVLRASYEELLDWKGRIGRSLMASRELLDRESSPEAHALRAELHATQRALSRLVSGATLADQTQRLDELRRERNRLELELRRSLALTQPEPTTLAALASSLPAGTAVLDLFVHLLERPGEREGAEHACAWIVRPDAELARVDLGPLAELEPALQRHLKRITRTRSTAILAKRGLPLGSAPEADPANANELSGLLWEPLAPHLEGVETLFVSPDGALGTLPFETLELADGTFLLEDLAFVYVADATSLVRRRSAPASVRESLLAVGAVDFEARGESSGPEGAALPLASPSSRLRGGFGGEWSALPATGPEARRVVELHGNADGEALLLLGAEATEERLKRELERFAVLHLATHGFFNPEGAASIWDAVRPDSEGRAQAAHLMGRHPGLLSGLVCAGANQETPAGAEDGYLTAEEVGWLDLGGAELVVLSACQTTLGAARSGEGLLGLRRAFRTAGAKTVVSSLWQVEDDSTADLMQEFYENLWSKGMGRLEALRAAQLAMLQRNRETHGEALPSTWGAFVLSGEWR